MNPPAVLPLPEHRTTAGAAEDAPLDRPVVAVLGLGYVGLPTGLALSAAGFEIVGVDISERRLADIRARQVDLLPADHTRLAHALEDPRVVLTSRAAALDRADVVLICVPTPIDERLNPDLGPLRGACATVVEHARAGQTIVLTSTSYVGTTRDLLVAPLQERGFAVGTDISVAFSPERIDPGNAQHEQASVPRVLGGVTPVCTGRAAQVLAPIAAGLHFVSSPEAAELTKLYENTFRAVNIALANELAGVSQRFGLDPIEVTEAAATKPYGFMAFYPGPGVGGHCIPCDPHYLLEPLHTLGGRAPLVEVAMAAIAHRPTAVVDRAAQVLAQDGLELEGAAVLVVGVTYKPGVQDVRESPSIQILKELDRRGARIAYHDPLVPALRRADEPRLVSVEDPDGADYDLVLVATPQPGSDLSWLEGCDRVLDGSYRTPGGRRRTLI